jgi:hypothetical protein
MLPAMVVQSVTSPNSFPPPSSFSFNPNCHIVYIAMRSGLSVFKLPLRQKRALFLLLAAILSYMLLSGVGLGSPKTVSSPGISPEKIADYLNSTSKVNEIYGLIHLATSGKAKHHVLYTHVADPTTPVDLSIYADGKDINWESEVSRLNTNHPIVVFSEVRQ